MEPGRLIADRYRLERLIGSGGMGFVYLARDEREGRLVAIKFLSEDEGDDPQRRKRFLREAWAVSQLSHPSIVRVYERGEEPDGVAWMAMEYIDGTSFGDVLDRGPLPLRDVATALAPVARALGAAHRAGFVHRDVKPDNVLLRGDGRPVLVDFGITRTIQHRAANLSSVDQLTGTGVLVGTPEYMSPEQVRGVALDGRSDQFSLAVVCFEALTGTRPFAGDNAMAVIAAVLTDPVAAVTDVVPGVPREVSDGIARALSKRPQDRFADIDAFADLLEEYMPTSMLGIDVRHLAVAPDGPDKAPPVDSGHDGAPTVMDVDDPARSDPTTRPRRAPSLPTFEEFARTVIEPAPIVNDRPSSTTDEMEVGARTLVRASSHELEAPAYAPPATSAPRPSYAPFQSPPPPTSTRRSPVGVVVAIAVAVIAVVALLALR